MQKFGYSSEIYNLDPKDLLSLPLSPSSEEHINDKIIILIGNDKLNQPDTLIRGRKIVEKAVADGIKAVPTRIAFIPRVRKYDFISPIIRVLRYKHHAFSSNIYHINPKDIRKLKIERGYRSSDNAYQFSNPRWALPSAEAKKRYDDLKKSMSKGYDDKFPIDIMLCRNFGIQDNVNQGHHRMSAALEIGLERISVKFSAVGYAPKLLRPLFRILAKISMLIKR